MRTIHYAAIAAVMAASFLLAPVSAAEDCEAIEERRAQTDCFVAEAHHAIESYMVNTCARQVIAAAMVQTITKAGLNEPSALGRALSDPEGVLSRVRGAVAESSKLLADLLWLLHGSDEREVRTDALGICVRELGKSPFDSEPSQTAEHSR